MCLLICMHVHLFHTRPLSRSPPAHFAVCMRPIVCVCVFPCGRLQVYEAVPCHSDCSQFEWRVESWSICTINAVDDLPACGEGVQSRKIRSVSQPALAGCLAGTAAPEQINLRCKQPVNSTDLNYLSFLVYQIRSYQRMKGRLKSNL